MATLRTIRLRIKGTKNIKQITRAMEAVSAVKMRKSQGVALAARPYATSALEILRNLKRSAGGSYVHPFLAANTEQTRKSEHGIDAERKVLLVVVTSDKGLAGPFNANVLKKAEAVSKMTRSSENATVEPQIAAVGKKAAEYFSRRGQKPIASWTGFGDFVTVEEIEPLFTAISDAFTTKRFDEVCIVYTNFLSAMKQEVVVRKLLPFSEEGLEEMVKGIVPERGRFSDADAANYHANATNHESANPPRRTNRNNVEYIFEPSPKEIFESILPALLRIQIYHSILEANASEHSSRMIAMRNATDNASELIKSYTVSMNKARQAAINKELAEITGGSEALAV